MKKWIRTTLMALLFCLALLPTAALADEPQTLLWMEDNTLMSGTTANGGSKVPVESGSYKLTGSSYKLNEDITLDKPLLITGTVTLDLNDHVLKRAEGLVIDVGTTSEEGILTLKDSSTTKTTRYFNIDSDTGLWKPASSGATANSVSGGVITADHARGVYLTKGSFTMESGSIVGCTSTDGGGVYIRSNTSFTMSGGKIVGCIASTTGGGVLNYGTFNMAGGTIEACTAPNGGGVYTNGSFTMTDGEIKNCSASSSANNDGGGGVHVTGSSSTFTMSGGTIDGGKTADSRDNNAENGGGVYIRSSTFVLSGTARIQNCKASTSGGGVYIKSANSLKITGGTITTCTAASGGGLYLDSNGNGKLTMSGGIIQDCTATSNGGGVYVIRCGFKMSDKNASIQNCTANNGGGVYAGSTFTMSGGTIDGGKTADSTDNNAKNGGGVYVNGTFKMSGGTIKNCKVSEKGGGVYVVEYETFDLSGGSVITNTAANGGGVYLLGTFNMSGGSLTGNTATSDGGGVYDSGTFNLSGDTDTGSSITGNGATGDGGGVYVAEGKTLTVGKASGLSKVMIDSNTSNNVYLADSSKIGTAAGGLTGGSTITVTIPGSSGPLKFIDTIDLNQTDHPASDPDTNGYTWGTESKKLTLGENIMVGKIVLPEGEFHIAPGTNVYVGKLVGTQETHSLAVADGKTLALSQGIEITGGSLTINGGELTTEEGISVPAGTLTIKNGAKVTAKNGGLINSGSNTMNYAIYAKNMVVEDGAKVTVPTGTASKKECRSIYAVESLSVTGAGTKVTVTGGDLIFPSLSRKSYGIYVETGTMTLADGAEVTATGGKAGVTGDSSGDDVHSYGVYAKGGLTVSGGTLNANGNESSVARAYSQAYSIGIGVEGGITISGGSVNAKGYKATAGSSDSKPYSIGIYTEGNSGSITISGGTLIAEGGAVTSRNSNGTSCGIYVAADLTVSGEGTLTATGGTVTSDSRYDIYYGKYGFAYTALTGTLTYDGRDQLNTIKSIVTVDEDKQDDVTVAVCDPNGVELTEAKNAGTYTVQVTTGETVIETYTVTVAKATADKKHFTFTAPTLTYNGSNQYAAIKNAVKLADGITGLEFEVFVSNPVGEVNLVKDATYAMDYKVYVKVNAASTNFEATTENGIELGRQTIALAKLTKSDFTFTAPTLTYTGSDQIGAIKEAVKLQDSVNGTGALTKTVYTKSGETETTVTAAENAGEYYIKVTADMGSAYAELTEAIEFGPVTIAKAQATASFAKAAVKAAKDGTVTNALTTDPTGLPAAYSSSEESVATVATDGTVTLVGEGTTTITAAITATENYKGATASYTLTVLPAGVTVYTITVNAGENGTVDTPGGEYGSNETVTVTATPNPGYRFVKWTAEGASTAAETVVSTAAAYSFSPTESLTLTAHFEVIPSGGGSSAPTNPTVSTETTTAPDGSVTKTEIKKDGTVVETTTTPDGGTTKTETKTETKKDGSTVETRKETVTGKDGSTSTTETKTETRADGSSTTTRTETTKAPDGTGSETRAETKTDASGVTTSTETTKTTAPDGSSSTTTTTTDEGGTTTSSSVTVSGAAAKEARESGGSVTLPVEVPAGKNGESTTTVNVTVPAGSGPLTVEISVSNVTAGTVAILVNENGSETVVPLSKVTENGIQLTLEESATIKIVDNSKSFGDVKDPDFFSEAVQWASSRGITDGIGGGQFGPNLSAARAQLVTFLWRAAGCPVVNFAMDFSDVDEASFYGEAVRWAASLGIVGGYGDGAFGTNDAITREQMAVILYRFAQSVGMDTTQGGMAAREFEDYDRISDYALDAMRWAVNAGIVQGADGKLMPNDTCTRGQIVTMLYRLLGE